jgi:hypothetical protein
MKLPMTVRWATRSGIAEAQTESQDVSSRGIYFFLSKQIEDVSPVEIVLISSHYTPEEPAILARLFSDGCFIPKSEAGKALVPTVSRLLPDESKAAAKTALSPPCTSNAAQKTALGCGPARLP